MDGLIFLNVFHLRDCTVHIITPRGCIYVKAIYVYKLYLFNKMVIIKYYVTMCDWTVDPFNELNNRKK